jgi:hypothetical protein
MKFKYELLALAACALLINCAGAAVIQVQSDNLDYEAHKNTSTSALAISDGVQGDNRIGARTTTTWAASILPFAIPSIPSGEQIVAATLNVTFKGETIVSGLRPDPGDGNIDVYGLPFDPAPVAQDPNRWYGGPNDVTAGVTKLQDEFMTVAGNPAENTNVLVTSVDISTWLKSVYTAGAATGDFAILRLSYDANAINGNNRYRIVTSAGDGTNGPDANPHTIAEGAPYLSITTAPIPEPTTVSLLCLAALALAAVRRR